MPVKRLFVRCGLTLAATALCASLALPIAAAQDNSPAAVPAHIRATPIPADEMLEYRLLNNGTFDQFDIERAKAYRLSDWETAVVLKIAQESEMSYGRVMSMVASGKSLLDIAQGLGINWNSLRNEQKQEDEIAAYQSAYAGSGLNSLPRPYKIPGESKSAM